MVDITEFNGHLFLASCGTLPVMGAITIVQLSLAPSVCLCTAMRSGLRAIPSLSLQRRWFLRCLGSARARIDILVVLASLAVLRYTAGDGSDREGFLTSAPSALACTFVRTGLCTNSSLPPWTAVPAAAMVSPMSWQLMSNLISLGRVVRGPVPTNCSAWRRQLIHNVFMS